MTAKMVAVKDLQEGEILDSAVVSPAGKVLLSKDIKLSARAISLMRAWDISFVYIKSETEEEIIEKPDTLESKDLSGEFMKFFQEYDAAVTMASQAFDFVRSQNKVPVQYLKDTSFSIYSAILDRGAAVLNNLIISDYNLADEVTRHCVMVSYISSMIARHMHMSEEEVEGVTLAALLHDVGKLLQAKGETGKEHIINAAAMLKDVKGLTPEIMFGVIQHHEFMDGTGYPMGVRDNRIHPYARIISVADLFHTQAYIGEYSNPFPVLERLTKEQYTKFDPEVCHVFINKVRDSLLKSRVKLSDDTEGEIIYYHSLDSCLPIVRTDQDRIIDLGVSTDIKIRHIIAPEYLSAMSA